MSPSTPDRSGLRSRIHKLELDLVEAHAKLSQVTIGEEVPGLYLVTRFGALRALLPAAFVLEVASVVETYPLPDAPPCVLGGFIYRGQATVAVGAARLLGQTAPPSLDAHMVVLAGASHVALVVDRVEGLWEDPERVEGPSGGEEDSSRPPGLIGAYCRQGDQTLPLLSIEGILHQAHGKHAADGG